MASTLKPRLRYGRVLVIVVSVLLVAGCAIGLGIRAGVLGQDRSGQGAVATSGPGGHYVTRAGPHLYLDGKPYTFTGINIYNATSQGNCWYDMTAGTTLERSLQAIGPGGQVIRSWFFQNLATRDGARDWSAFDNLLRVAAAHGYKVIPVLANQWSDCEGWPGNDPRPGYRNESWYRTGYRTQPTAPGLSATYEQWLREVVSRYKDDRTILAWQLMNEAEDRVTYLGRCSATAGKTLADFAADMSSLVKSIDAHHLVSLGTVGSGQCGTSGQDYLTVHAAATIDLCEYHDYENPREEIPGDEFNGLHVRLDQCARLGKPLLVGELGLKPSDAGGSLQGRAALLESKVKAQFGAGVVAILAWDWRDGAHGGSDMNGYSIGPGDPALAVLARYAHGAVAAGTG
jgi:mannan endo-1,4-beta-mannosidase